MKIKKSISKGRPQARSGAVPSSLRALAWLSATLLPAILLPAMLLLSAMSSGCGGSSLHLAPSYVAVHNTMMAMGLAQTGEISEGSLPEGAEARFSRTLAAGDCYVFVALGGSGVSNIDLRVADSAGEPLAQDSTDNGQAATRFCPTVAGDYQLVLAMTAGEGAYALTSYSGMVAGGGGGAGASPGLCTSAIPLEAGTPVRGSTASAGSHHAGSCLGNSDAPENVYVLTLEQRAQVEVVLNSDFDGSLYIRANCEQANSEVACNDDAPNTSRSEVSATLDAGQYYIFVDGYGSASGEYEVSAQVNPLQTVAQICGSAQALVPGRAVTGSTAGRPNYFTATCAGGARSADRVYTMDVPTRSRVRVRMQSTFDGAIYVRSACDNPSSELACNDDHGDTSHSMLVTTLDPGRYYVYADGYSSSNQGDYSLRADLAPLTGGSAAADNCTNPGTLAPNQPVDLDTFAASDDFTGSCGGQGSADVVYRLTITSRSRLRARLTDPEFDSALYVISACGTGAGTPATNEVMCTTGQRRQGASLDANLQPGTYFLVVDGASADQFGSARLEMQLDDLQALERACQQAPRIRPGRTTSGDTSSSSDRFQATCAGNAASNDLVYRLVVPRRSRVRISSTQQYDGAIYIRSSCADISTEVACNDDDPDNRHSVVEAVLDRGTYFVFADGFSDSSQGSFTIDVALTRP